MSRIHGIYDEFVGYKSVNLPVKSFSFAEHVDMRDAYSRTEDIQRRMFIDRLDFRFATQPLEGMHPAVTEDGKRVWVEVEAVYPQLAIPDGVWSLQVHKAEWTDENAVTPWDRKFRLREEFPRFSREAKKAAASLAEEISREFRAAVGGEWCETSTGGSLDPSCGYGAGLLGGSEGRK